MPPKGEKNAVAVSTEAINEVLMDPKTCELFAKALAPFLTKIISDALDVKFDALNAQMTEMDSEITHLKSVVQAQAKMIDDMDAYSRLDQLVVRGLPERSFAEAASGEASSSAATSSGTRPGTVPESSDQVEKTFLDFCHDKLHIALDTRDISIIHRMKAGTKDTVRPIIVRFTSKKARNCVFAARKVLKGSGSKVFLSEHLTKANSSIFFEARGLLRNRKIFGCWTSGGSVYIKTTTDQNGRPVLVRSLEELRNY